MSIEALKETTQRINQTSERISKGVRNPELIEDTVSLIEDEATFKVQLTAVKAKNDLLGDLLDIVK